MVRCNFADDCGKKDCEHYEPHANKWFNQEVKCTQEKDCPNFKDSPVTCVKWPPK